MQHDRFARWMPRTLMLCTYLISQAFTLATLGSLAVVTCWESTEHQVMTAGHGVSVSACRKPPWIVDLSKVFFGVSSPDTSANSKHNLSVLHVVRVVSYNQDPGSRALMNRTFTTASGCSRA